MPTPPAPAHRLAWADAGRSVSVAVGQQIELCLPETPGSGFVWQADPSGDAAELLSLQASAYRPPAAPGQPVGGQGLRTLSYRASQPGHGVLTLRCERAGREAASAGPRFSVTLTVRPAEPPG